MSIFDIIGPVMIGPSSSHTAGAARLGHIAGNLLGEPVKRAVITLFESFAATSDGHGTAKAIVGGILGFPPDDERLPESFKLAAENGLEYRVILSPEPSEHPNTAVMSLSGESGRVDVTGISVGGGSIEITRINGYGVSFGADYHTLVVSSADKFGTVAHITRLLTDACINIAFMRLSRRKEGQIMVLETDQEISDTLLAALKEYENVSDAIYLRPVV